MTAENSPIAILQQELEDQHANIIFGSTFDESLHGKVRVSVVATGIADPDK
jgi:cell division protein FtsZ